LALRAGAILSAVGGQPNAAVQADFEEALRIARGMGDDLRVSGMLSWYAEWCIKFDPQRGAALGREALAIVRKADDSRRAALSYNLAAYLLVLGETDEAIGLAQDALRLSVAANERPGVTFALQRVALGLAQRARFEEAARLFGFVEAQFAALDLASDYAEELVRQRTTEALKAAPSPDQLERFTVEGAEMLEADAIKAALAATA